MADYQFGLVFDWNQNRKKLGAVHDYRLVKKYFHNAANVTVLRNTGFTFVNFNHEEDLLHWFTRRGATIIDDMFYRVNYKKLIRVSIHTQREIKSYLEDLISGNNYKIIPEIVHDKHAWLHFTNEKDAQEFYLCRNRWFPHSTEFVYKNRSDNNMDLAMQDTDRFLQEIACQHNQSKSQSPHHREKLPEKAKSNSQQLVVAPSDSANASQHPLHQANSGSKNVLPAPLSENNNNEPIESGQNTRSSEGLDLENMADDLRNEIVFCAKKSEDLMIMNRCYIDNIIFDESDSQFEALISINKKIRKVLDIYDDIKITSQKLKRQKMENNKTE